MYTLDVYIVYDSENRIITERKTMVSPKVEILLEISFLLFFFHILAADMFARAIFCCIVSALLINTHKYISPLSNYIFQLSKAIKLAIGFEKLSLFDIY